MIITITLMAKGTPAVITVAAEAVTMTEFALPSAFIERLRRLLGDETNAFLDSYDLPLRRGLRVNTLWCDTDTFLTLFPHPLNASPFADDAFYLDAPHKAGADPLHHAGAYYMQEPSASSAVTVLRPQKGEYILDLCAAPGGKSTQIAAALGGTGLLWCNEYIKSRAQILLQNLERLGVRNAVVSNADTSPLCKQLEGCFDAVLADVPCSGEGMFRKED
ncbi:MAG: RsmB/NOP family class I SAM-dependent RNA methyltransferase, partial [Clostridia bacterium]|nr:RsmB/NOP family class I SAM-dependent RNA methyltransferase [Clostridia bacterium]